jgi:hypothetical protein
MSRALLRAVTLVVAVLTTSCATGGGAHVTVGTTLTPAQEAGLREVKALIETAARVYQVSPPAIMVGGHAGDATFGAVYRRGIIIFTPPILTSPSRDKVTAHELGHYVLRHDQSTRAQEVKEHEANIEAVRILQATRGLNEEAATRQVVEALDSLHRSVKSGRPIARGHAHPCEEIKAVLAAYPAQRAWAEKHECAPAEWARR